MNEQPKEKSRRGWEIFLQLLGAIACAVFSLILSNMFAKSPAPTAGGSQAVSQIVTQPISNLISFGGGMISTIFDLIAILVVLYIVYFLIRLSHLSDLHDLWDLFC